jgi:hypothetical protein
MVLFLHIVALSLNYIIHAHKPPHNFLLSLSAKSITATSGLASLIIATLVNQIEWYPLALKNSS